jgi:hypothetical protein
MGPLIGVPERMSGQAQRHFWLFVCFTGSMLLTACAGEPFFGQSGQNDRSPDAAPIWTASKLPPLKRSAQLENKGPSAVVSKRLIGLNETQLKSLLGPPLVETLQPPAKAWHYRTGRCNFDLALYPDVETRIYHALSYEVISDDGSNEGKRRCLAEFAARIYDK